MDGQFDDEVAHGGVNGYDDYLDDDAGGMLHGDEGLAPYYDDDDDGGGGGGDGRSARPFNQFEESIPYDGEPQYDDYADDGVMYDDDPGMMYDEDVDYDNVEGVDDGTKCRNGHCSSDSQRGASVFDQFVRFVEFS